MSMKRLPKISHTCLMISVPVCPALQTSELFYRKGQVVLHWSVSQKLSKLLFCDVWELLNVTLECRDEEHRSQVFKVLSLERDISAVCEQKRGKSRSKTVSESKFCRTSAKQPAGTVILSFTFLLNERMSGWTQMMNIDNTKSVWKMSSVGYNILYYIKHSCQPVSDAWDYLTVLLILCFPTFNHAKVFNIPATNINLLHKQSL